MAKKASTHYKRPDSKRSVDGRWRTLCGILVHRKQLVGLDATCATCGRRDFEVVSRQVVEIQWCRS